MSVELSYPTAALARMLFWLIATGLLLVKISAILALAFAANWLMQRKSAAQRHFIWSVAIGSVLTLTLMTAVVPTIGARVRTNAVVSSMLRAMPAVQSSDTLFRISHAAGSYPTAGTTSVARVDVGQELRRFPVINVDNKPSAKTPVDLSFSFIRRTMLAIAALYLVWFVGTIVLFARIVNAHLKLRALVKNATNAAHPSLAAYTLQLSAQLDITRLPRVLVHKNIRTPCMAGWLRPVVLLPESSNEWSDSQLRAVLSHEFAHVARSDFLAQVLATVACALYWFHPAVWIASRKLRNECERAADDCATSGASAVQYAEHLLSLADRSSPHPSAPTIALGMAHISQLESRIRAMLNNKIPRSAFSRNTRRLASAGALLVLAPVSALRTSGDVEAASTRPLTTVERLDEGLLGNIAFPKGRMEASTDSVIDRTIDVGPSDIFNLSVELSGDLVFHASSNSTVRVRAVLPHERVFGSRISLTRVSNGATFNASVINERAAAARARYEIWMPANMQIYVQPTSAENVHQLQVFGIKDVPGINQIQIDGSLNISCARIVVARIVGDLHGKLSCRFYTLPVGRVELLRVLVNGIARTDSVEAITSSDQWKSLFSKTIGNALPTSQLKADSVTASNAISPASSPSRRAK